MQFWPNLEASFQNLMTSGIIGLLSTVGLTIFSAIAIIRITMFGLAVTNGRYGDKWLDPFIELMMPIVFGLLMLNYWVNPIPGIGFSFPHIITGTGDWITHQISQQTVQDVITTLGQWQAEMASPGLANFVGMFDYAIVTVLIWIMQASGFLLNAFAMVATAVCIVWGPLAASCMMFPEMEWYFKGWLRSFWQYATLKVTISIIVLVVGNFVVRCMTALPHKSVGDLAANIVPIMVVLLTGIFCVFKSGDIHNHINSGASGSSTGFFGALLGSISSRV
jgi:hypothetical protein